MCLSSINYTSCMEGRIRISTIIWTVPNFIYLVQTEDAGENIENKFRLKIQFSGEVCEIYYSSTGTVFLKSALTICLKESEERTVVIKDYQMVTADEWQYLATLERRQYKVYHEDKEVFLLSGVTLRLKIQFMETDDNNINKHLVPETQLSNDFKDLLNNGLFADVIIKSIEGVEYKTHKAVLASRSPVLRALFEHNMTESRTNIVESTFESEILGEVLTFIYSDKAPRVDEIPDKLLAAADYYQLGRLKYLCEEAMQKKLTVDNAIDTLQLADLHSASVLKQMTLEFIKDGHARHIIQTEGWSNIKSVELIKTIYEFIV